MSGGEGRSLRSAVGSYFLRPADGAPRQRSTGAAATAWAPPAAAAATPAAAEHVEDGARIALLAGGSDAWGLGGAVALAAARSGVALLASWGARTPAVPGAPGIPAARRAVVALRARGLAASARGRLVALALPEAEEDAVAALRAAELVPGPAARVALLGRSRGDGWAGVLATRDLVLVGPPAEPALAEVAGLAVERLVAEGAHARALPAVPPPATLALAATGLAIPGALGGLRRAVRIR